MTLEKEHRQLSVRGQAIFSFFSFASFSLMHLLLLLLLAVQRVL